MPGEGFLRAPPDSTGKALRLFLRQVAGVEVGEEYAIDLPATVVYGANNAVPQGATETLISYTAPATPSVRLRGVLGTGSGDGYWQVLVNGAVRLFGRTHQLQRDLERWLLNPLVLPASAIVEVKVRNESLGTAEYEALLVGDGDAPS
jgi:hypothetical protein